MTVTLLGSFIGLLIIIGAAFALFNYMEENSKRAYLGCALTIPGLLLLSALIFLDHSGEANFINETQWPIYALEDQSNLKGNRYYFEEELQYYYLTDYKDGLKLYSIPSENAYVVESNEEPKIVQYNYGTYNWITKLLYALRLTTRDHSINETEYKIVVPSETISTDFNLNLS